MGAHSCDLYAEPTDSDSDSPDDEAGADSGAATVNATAANAMDDCEVEMCMGTGFPMGPGIPWEWE